MKLTATTVRTQTLPGGKSEAIFFDDDVPGFGLRLRERGSRTFVFQYKLGSKQRRMTLGKATPERVANIRKIIDKLDARVRLGEDPASDKADAKVKAAQTYGVTAAQFLETLRPRYRPRAHAEIDRHLTKHAKNLNELQVAKISQADIASILTTVAKNSGAVTANRVRTSLSTFFAWTMQQALAATNPVLGTAKNEERSRDRVLAPSELRLVWNALGDDDYGAIVKLLALTGQRENEIGSLQRSEIHEALIVLAPERTKNKRPHTVPLAPGALSIIEAREPQDADRDLVFGRGQGGFSGWSKSKERLDERIKEANGGKPIAHWTLHDLRRTFATYAGGGMEAHQLAKLPKHERELATGLGIQPHVIEAILNHVSGHKAGVAGIYQRSSYEREKRTALDLWAMHLLSIVEGRASNVTPLRREA